jgi:hypothetical protein
MDSIEQPLGRRKSACLKFCALLVAGVLSPAWAQEISQEISIAPTSPDIASSDLLRAGVDDSQLQPGEFLWLPAAEGSTGAPPMIIVNLAAQRVYVYRDGEPIAVSTVSTGRPGRETPTGTFEILQKERMHHSNLYDDAAMPFMQRLTWSGLSLHAGHLPGYPASHGCIRLPAKFAEQLYQITEPGEFVVISDDGSVEALARAGLDAQLHPLADTAAKPYDVVGAVGPEPAAEPAGVDRAPHTAGDDPEVTFGYSR